MKIEFDTNDDDDLAELFPVLERKICIYDEEKENFRRFNIEVIDVENVRITLEKI